MNTAFLSKYSVYTGAAALVLSAALLNAAPVWAQSKPAEPSKEEVAAQREAAKRAAEREAERTRIIHQRTQIEQQRADIEVQCYQRFVVQDCLEDAKRQARLQDEPLRQREVQINEEERHERAQTRLLEIEAKKAQKSAIPMSSEQRAPRDAKGIPQPSGQAGAVKPPVDVKAVQSQRAQEAQQRAQKQSDYVRSHQEQMQQRKDGEGEREAAARAEYEAKLKSAAERKAKAAQDAKERGPTAAPLPAAP